MAPIHNQKQINFQTLYANRQLKYLIHTMWHIKLVINQKDLLNLILKPPHNFSKLLYILSSIPGADKSLARPGRKQATATKL